jgi:hypothetical protein
MASAQSAMASQIRAHKQQAAVAAAAGAKSGGKQGESQRRSENVLTFGKHTNSGGNKILRYQHVHVKCFLIRFIGWHRLDMLDTFAAAGPCTIIHVDI